MSERTRMEDTTHISELYLAIDDLRRAEAESLGSRFVSMMDRPALCDDPIKELLIEVRAITALRISATKRAKGVVPKKGKRRSIGLRR